jgi:hypothetical protein
MMRLVDDMSGVGSGADGAATMRRAAAVPVAVAACARRELADAIIANATAMAVRRGRRREREEAVIAASIRGRGVRVGMNGPTWS